MLKMEDLNLPNYNQLLKVDLQNKTIYDAYRKKKVALTPEEWVRQNFLAYMVNDLNFPAGLLSVEMPIELNGLKRRCDIVAFDKTGMPKVIVECKASTIKINQKTFTQIATYNIKLQVDYLIITNGLNHYCCIMDYANNTYKFLEKIPSYNQITE